MIDTDFTSSDGIPPLTDYLIPADEFRVSVMDHKRNKVFVVTQRCSYDPITFRGDGPGLEDYRRYNRDRFNYVFFQALLKNDALYDVSIGRLEVTQTYDSRYSYRDEKTIDEQVREALAYAK
jgi:hypothetical protein